MVQLALSLFGQFEVKLDGHPVAGFQSDKARSLLAYLVVELDLPHHREQIANLFWPEVSDATARSSLRSALANLRRVIGDATAQPPFLNITQDTIQFNPHSSFWLDVAEFNRSLQFGEKSILFQDEVTTPLPIIESIKYGISLYRGNFLEGLSVKGCPEFDSWVYLLRERFQNQASNALDKIAGYFERCGEIDQSMIYARRRVELEPWQEEAHYDLIRLIALSGDRSAALAQYETCQRFLADELGVEPAIETVRLAEAIREDRLIEIQPFYDNLSPVPGEAPFKGLQYFDIMDADLYFGREALTAQLGDHLQKMQLSLIRGNGHPGSHFLAIIGASGSGKSSLLRAGLAALVKRNAFTETDVNDRTPKVPWDVKIITPTAHPLERLAGIEEQTQGLRLLIVDQFEELFTICRSEAEREAFIEQLLHLEGLVVIALRADFYAHCGQYPALRHALSTRQEYLGSMSLSELRRAIEEPAHRNGWLFERGLVDLILKDVGASPEHPPEPGALPLLSHALLETWKRRRGRMLLLIGYQEAGGVHGVIAQTAETVYSGLDPNHQAITRRIFLRMTELGEGTQDTRRRASLSELVPVGGSREDMIEVIRQLAIARLVVTEWNPTNQQEEVEIAHEALIHHWPRLRKWLEEDREELRLGKRVRDATQEWLSGRRMEQFLIHRSDRLAAALQAVQAGRLAFSQEEMEYLLACLEQSERERKARERWRKSLIIATIIIVIAMVLIALWGLTQAEYAKRQADISLAQQLAAQAEELMADPAMNELSMLLSIESIRNSPGRAANETLAIGLALMPDTIIKMKQDNRISTVVFRPDGEWVVSGGWDNTARIWEVRTGREVARMIHSGPIWAVAFSPDGKRIVSGSQDGTARVWDASNGHELARLVHLGAVWSVAFSPDGNWIVTGSEDKTARIWDTHNWSEVAKVQHGGIVYSVAFSPDGRRVVSGSQDGTARIWDPVTGRGLIRMQNSSELWKVAFSPDGTKLLSSGWDGVIWLWDAETGEKLAQMQHNGAVRSIAFNSTGTRIVSGSDDGTARVWDADSGRELSRVQHEGRVLAVEFSPDDREVVSASEDGAARVWDVDTGRDLTHMQHVGPALAVHFSPEGKRVVSAGWDKTVRVWQVNPGRELLQMRHDSLVFTVEFSLDGSRILSSSNDNTVRVWNAENGKELARMLHGGGALSAVFSIDGKLVISGNDDGSLRVWQAETGQEVTRIRQGQPVWAVAFNPDHQLAISGSQDSTVQIWDLTTRQELKRMSHDGPITDVSFSPDGKLSISGSQDNTVRVWDVQTGHELGRMNHDGPVTSIVISPDGKLVISGSQDGTVRIWDLQTGHELRRMKHNGAVMSVAISMDGKWVLSSSEDATARIWEAGTGNEVARIQHDQAVTSVAFSADGRQVITGSQDGAIRVWLWQDEDLIQLACKRLPRNLTLAEWQEYMGNRRYRQTCTNLPPEK